MTQSYLLYFYIFIVYLKNIGGTFIYVYRKDNVGGKNDDK